MDVSWLQLEVVPGYLAEISWNDIFPKTEKSPPKIGLFWPQTMANLQAFGDYSLRKRKVPTFYLIHSGLVLSKFIFPRKESIVSQVPFFFNTPGVLTTTPQNRPP